LDFLEFKSGLLVEQKQLEKLQDSVDERRESMKREAGRERVGLKPPSSKLRPLQKIKDL